MTEKRYLLKYLPYECSNGEMIETDPYYVDTKQEYVDTDDFRIEGMLTMSDKQILELLNENEMLKAQLYCTNEGGVCSICKHHYLIKNTNDNYYTSKCKKEHEKCSKETLKHCKDFKLKGCGDIDE